MRAKFRAKRITKRFVDDSWHNLASFYRSRKTPKICKGEFTLVLKCICCFLFFENFGRDNIDFPKNREFLDFEKHWFSSKSGISKILWGYSIIRQNVSGGDSSRASICIKILKQDTRFLFEILIGFSKILIEHSVLF